MGDYRCIGVYPRKVGVGVGWGGDGVGVGVELSLEKGTDIARREKKGGGTGCPVILNAYRKLSDPFELVCYIT